MTLSHQRATVPTAESQRFVRPHVSIAMCNVQNRVADGVSGPPHNMVCGSNHCFTRHNTSDAGHSRMHRWAGLRKRAFVCGLRLMDRKRCRRDTRTSSATTRAASSSCTCSSTSAEKTRSKLRGSHPEAGSFRRSTACIKARSKLRGSKS